MSTPCLKEVPYPLGVTLHFLSLKPCLPLTSFLCIDLPILGINGIIQCIAFCVRFLSKARNNPGGSSRTQSGSRTHLLHLDIWIVCKSIKDFDGFGVKSQIDQTQILKRLSIYSEVTELI